MAICAGAAFGSWSLLMSLTGLRSGGVAFALVAGTLLVVTPWFLLANSEPWLAPARDARFAILAGVGAACLNGVGMVFLPRLLDAPPAAVGTRMLILNVTVVSVIAIWSVAFGGQTLSASKLAGLLLAVAAIALLGR
jgi:drug/metabolite transporter (DMT)-like permease